MIRDTANKLIEGFYGLLPYETATHLANAQKELLKAVGHRTALALGALPANHRALLLLRRSAFFLGYPFDQFHRLTNLQERLPNTPRKRDIRPGASSESSSPAASRRASSS